MAPVVAPALRAFALLAFLLAPSSEAAGCPFSGGGHSHEASGGSGTITHGRRATNTSRKLQQVNITPTVPFDGSPASFCPVTCRNNIRALPGTLGFCDLNVGLAEFASATPPTVAADTSCGACLLYQSCQALVEQLVPQVALIAQPVCPAACAADIQSPANAAGHCGVILAQDQLAASVTGAPVVTADSVPDPTSPTYCFECLMFDACLGLVVSQSLHSAAGRQPASQLTLLPPTCF
jgi:hypothetical protein